MSENFKIEEITAEEYLLARKKRIEDARSSALHFFEGKNLEQMKLETGTAIGGAIGAKGKIVILGADGQMTSGYQKMSGFDKIFVIDRYTIIGITGTVAFLQDIVKIFEIEINYIQMSRSDGTFISPNGKANILAGLVKQVIALPLIYGIGLGFLLGVYDPKDDEARLFSIGSLGSIIEPPNHIAADGCGKPWVCSVLEDNYGKLGGIDITELELLKLIKRAINSAIRNDTYCGKPRLIYIVDKDGARRTK